jgi:hypothetical protein
MMDRDGCTNKLTLNLNDCITKPGSSFNCPVEEPYLIPFDIL